MNKVLGESETTKGPEQIQQRELPRAGRHSPGTVPLRLGRAAERKAVSLAGWLSFSSPAGQGEQGAGPALRGFACPVRRCRRCAAHTPISEMRTVGTCVSPASPGHTHRGKGSAPPPPTRVCLNTGVGEYFPALSALLHSTMRGVRPHGDQHTVIPALDGAALRGGSYQSTVPAENKFYVSSRNILTAFSMLKSPISSKHQILQGFGVNGYGSVLFFTTISVLFRQKPGIFCFAVL